MLASGIQHFSAWGSTLNLYIIFCFIYLQSILHPAFIFLITCYSIISSENINLTPTHPVFVRAWGLYKISDDFLLLRNVLQFWLCNNQQPKCFSESIKHDLKVESHLFILELRENGKITNESCRYRRSWSNLILTLGPHRQGRRLW